MTLEEKCQKRVYQKLAAKLFESFELGEMVFFSTDPGKEPFRVGLVLSSDGSIVNILNQTGNIFKVWRFHVVKTLDVSPEIGRVS